MSVLHKQQTMRHDGYVARQQGAQLLRSVLYRVVPCDLNNAALHAKGRSGSSKPGKSNMM